jgi:hypothetical protein
MGTGNEQMEELSGNKMLKEEDRRALLVDLPTSVSINHININTHAEELELVLLGPVWVMLLW